MAGADKADHSHARRDGRGHPRQAVLDYDAAFGHDPHSLGRVKEQIGRRLAARHFGRAEDVRMEPVVEADQRQRMFEPFGPAARGDANLAGQRIEDRADAGDCLQLRLEQGPQPRPVAIGEIGGKRAVPRLEIGHHAGKADAGIAVADLVDRQLDAAFGETFPVGADRQKLAVDQDPVAIEDNEIPVHYAWLLTRPRRFASVARNVIPGSPAFAYFAAGSAWTMTIVTLSTASRASTWSRSRRPASRGGA